MIYIQSEYLYNHREFVNGNRLTKLYYDNKTLAENCGSSIHDYKQICIQRKWRKNEPDITKKHILLNCVRWYRQRHALGPLIEFAFLKRTKIQSELKTELSEISGIHQQYIQYTMVHGYQLKDYATNSISPVWNSGVMTTNCTLVSRPWMCKQGDVLLYADSRELRPKLKQRRMYV